MRIECRWGRMSKWSECQSGLNDKEPIRECNIFHWPVSGRWIHVAKLLGFGLDSPIGCLNIKKAMGEKSLTLSKSCHIRQTFGNSREFTGKEQNWDQRKSLGFMVDFSKEELNWLKLFFNGNIYPHSMLTKRCLYLNESKRVRVVGRRNHNYK